MEFNLEQGSKGSGADAAGRRFVASKKFSYALLFAVAAIAIWIKWGKLDSLLWQDPAWWLNEYSRYAGGERPYRDFFWPYGPLSADIFGLALKYFGAHFAVVQSVVDALSLIVVFLVYAIARRMLPAPLAAWTAICFIAVGITARAYFSLFSLIGYTPAVHVAAAGLLLAIWAVFAYLDDGRWRAHWMALGAWAACLGKQETLAACVALFLLLALVDRRLAFKDRPTNEWLRNYLRLGLIWFAIPFIAYCWWASYSGWDKFVACIGGFGLAGISCPWWPTGFGVTGGLIELGEAWTLLMVASLFVAPWRARLARWYWLAWLVAGGAVAGAVWFNWSSYSDLLFGPGRIVQRLQRQGPELLSSSAVLRPVLVAGYFYAGGIIFSAWKNSWRFSKTQARDLVLVGLPCVMGLRSLFGSILWLNLLEVPAIDYPFVLLAGSCLLYGVLARGHAEGAPAQNRAAVAFCCSILIGYSAIRVAGGYSGLLADSSYPEMDTPAGRVHLKMKETEKPILDYVLAHTTRSDTILELPFGGGISFASGRPQPTYSTLFIQLRPPTAIQQEDMRRIADHPPSVVIAPRGEPRLGTLYGIPDAVGCVFPKLVWQPDRPASDPSYIFPVIDYIERHYHVDAEIGRWALLRPDRQADIADSGFVPAHQQLH